MKEIKEILDKRAEITSSWPFVFVAILVLLVLVLLYVLKDKIFYLISTMRIKHIEKQIRKHSVLLKDNSNPKEVTKLDSLLLSLFEIYKTKLPRPVSFDRLFPLDERTIMGELDEFELEMKNRLTRFYVLSQNIGRYYETEFGKSITITELIRRLWFKCGRLARLGWCITILVSLPPVFFLTKRVFCSIIG